MRKIIFNHLGEFLHMKFYITCLIQICKSHSVCDLRLLMLVSHIEDVERQPKKVEDNVYDIQLKVEVNAIKR